MRGNALVLWLARQLRHLAQWLDPLPDAEAALHAHIEQLRASHAAALQCYSQATDDAHQELKAMQGLREHAEEALYALELLHEHCIPVQHDALYDAAKRATADWEGRQAPSGEFKRHQVYASLIDAFPERPKREIALALEAALWP